MMAVDGVAGGVAEAGSEGGVDERIQLNKQEEDDLKKRLIEYNELHKGVFPNDGELTTRLWGGWRIGMMGEGDIMKEGDKMKEGGRGTGGRTKRDWIPSLIVLPTKRHPTNVQRV